MLSIMTLPFLGTALGAGCVFFLKKEMNKTLQRGLAGFAAVWSLLIPALEQCEDMGKLSFIPAVIGFLFGIAFLLLLDHIIPHLHAGNEEAEGPKSNLKKTTMLVLAVTLHNIPEGMAVGVVFAGWLSGVEEITLMGAFALALGIAIQNFPEGAIISMPLISEGVSKPKAFLYGVLSGIVEPMGVLLTVLVAGSIIPLIPYCLNGRGGTFSSGNDCICNRICINDDFGCSPWLETDIFSDL